MRRREIIAGLVAAAWPLVAGAQQPERVRRVGVLMGFDENDPEAKGWVSGFKQGLTELGWTDGRNMRMDVRWAAADIERLRSFAKELVDTQPDAILGGATVATAAHQRETRTIPIVFVLVGDPVGNGFVASLPSPGGNITGFGCTEETIAGKLLQLLTEIAPGVKRAAIMFNPDTAPYVRSYYLPVFETTARLLSVVPIVAPVHSDAEIETVITALGRESGGALVVPGDIFTTGRRASIISIAARNRIPAAYANNFVRNGGLLFYGPDIGDEFRRAAPYVDRILRGTQPADLPVQLPVKLEMALNAKTAKTLGLTIPSSILLRADEVIE
jgi:putative ABC transport system substrate-binding protein